MKLKFKILNEYGLKEPLQKVAAGKFFFPYENGEVLTKSNMVIDDMENSIVSIDLSDFEVQGLKAERDQTVSANLFDEDGNTIHVVFHKGLQVEMKDGRKVLAYETRN